MHACSNFSRPAVPRTEKRRTLTPFTLRSPRGNAFCPREVVERARRQNGDIDVVDEQLGDPSRERLRAAVHAPRRSAARRARRAASGVMRRSAPGRVPLSGGAHACRSKLREPRLGRSSEPALVVLATRRPRAAPRRRERDRRRRGRSRQRRASRERRRPRVQRPARRSRSPRRPARRSLRGPTSRWRSARRYHASRSSREIRPVNRTLSRPDAIREPLERAGSPRTRGMGRRGQALRVLRAVTLVERERLQRVLDPLVGARRSDRQDDRVRNRSRRSRISRGESSAGGDRRPAPRCHSRSQVLRVEF